MNDQDNGTKKTGKKLIVPIAAAAVLAIVGGLVVFSNVGGVFNSGANTGSGNQQVTDLSSAQNELRIPVSSITNTLSFYTYQSNGTAIKFFAVKGTDGNIHVAFDTCDVCGPKGYTQSGGDVVCSNCDKHFAIDSIGTANVNGGCWPSHLSMSINGDSVIINTSDVVAKESAFKK